MPGSLKRGIDLARPDSGILLCRRLGIQVTEGADLNSHVHPMNWSELHYPARFVPASATRGRKSPPNQKQTPAASSTHHLSFGGFRTRPTRFMISLAILAEAYLPSQASTRPTASTKPL